MSTWKKYLSNIGQLRIACIKACNIKQILILLTLLKVAAA